MAKKCGLCLADAPEDLRVRLMVHGQVSINCRICTRCFDVIDALRIKGLAQAREL